MKHRLSDKELKDEEIIYNEKDTADLIHDTILDKPFLGFFQNARLFQSSKDLDGLLRARYGDNTVVRISMGLLDGTNHTKSAQYSIDVHKLKGCVLTPQHRRAWHDSKLG